jgi:hypothetical protein
MTRKVIITPVEPLAWRLPEGSKRAGHSETKFRQALNLGELAYVENGEDKLVEDAEIQRWLRSKRKRAGVAEAEVRSAIKAGELAGTVDDDGGVTIEDIDHFRRWLASTRQRQPQVA